jgi:hypothetical protein
MSYGLKAVEVEVVSVVGAAVCSHDEAASRNEEVQ